MTRTTIISRPYLLDLQDRGFIEAVTYHDYSTQRALAHYVGGLPYALPPLGPFRFQRPRPLPPCYRYGSSANPGRFIGTTGLCPQPNHGNEDTSNEWDEDCLQMNIWIPVGPAPAQGWPVIVWYHGGFLQFGNPQEIDFTNLLSETTCKAIIVTPGYRLNIFGFLASKDLLDEGVKDFSTNNGFWDQRLALEFVWKNIHYFGGDASNITIGGYSAGSHSAFQQLAYDLQQPDSKAIVRRALMLSNGPGMQPKSLDEAQLQFDELASTLRIPATMTPAEKLAVLRTLSPKTLIEASAKIKYHQFRGVTDDIFIKPNLLASLDNGTFAQTMQRRNIKLLTGECRDEHFVYGTWRTPENSYNALFQRLQADYPLEACTALMHYYFPNRELGHRYKTWQDAFGHIYADIQIHHLERGMVNSLVQHGAGDLVYRYRIEWRAKCCDKTWPVEWGVTHGTDAMGVWFWGAGERLSFAEQDLVRRAFHDLFAKFVRGEEVHWGTQHALQLRTMKPDGRVVIEADAALTEGVKVWNILKSAGVIGATAKGSETVHRERAESSGEHEYLHVRALYDFHAEAHTELSFRAGDVIMVVGQCENGWWDGVLNGTRGWIPSNYCQVVEKAKL